MASVAATGMACAQLNFFSQSLGGVQAAAMPKMAMLNRLSVQEISGQALRVARIGAAPIGNSSSTRKIVCQSLGERTQKTQSPPTNMIQQETVISTSLASRWREIQGANDWQGLLDPLDMDMRMELIRYGEFAQACYDAFDNQPHSKYMGSSLFNKEKMFERVGLPNTGYEITDYLFATTSVESFLLRNEAPDAWSRSSNWVGYVAVCTDPEIIKKMGRRDIVIAWRGTATKLEWAANLARSLVPDALDDRPKNGKEAWNMKVLLEEGFLNLYTTANSQTRYNQASVRVQILMELKRLIKKYDNEDLSITITGHSLGGAMAVLSAYDVAMSGVNRHFVETPIKPFGEKTEPTPTSDPSKTKEARAIPVTAFTFAGPRVGNNPFADRIRELGVKVLRVTNIQDMVPKVPSLLLNEEFTMFNNLLDKFPWTYSHVGQEIQLDHDSSPELKRRGNPVNAHNMEAYLHLLTGYHGVGKPFDPCVDRDLALINKASDFVCPRRTGIPGNWWQPENKGLVRNSEGKWVQVEREYEDLPDHLIKEKKSAIAEELAPNTTV